MDLQRSDYDRASRHIKRAIESLLPEASYRIKVFREILWLIDRRLSPGDFFAGNAAAEVTLLRELAAKVAVPAARLEILRALTVLDGRWSSNFVDSGIECKCCPSS